MPEDDFMKSIGYPSGSKAGSPPAAKADPGERYQGILAPGPVEGVQRGIAKGAAELGVGAARLAGKGIGAVSPNTRSELGELVSRIPGSQQLQEFADRPYADPGEAVGDIGGSLALGGGVGKIGVEAGMQGLARMLGPTSRAIIRGSPGNWRLVGFTPTRWGKAANVIAPAAEAATKGAIGGAIANPDDPTTGAEVGAAAGIVPGGLSRGMRGRTGQYLGGALARGAGGALAGGSLGYLTGGGEGAERGAIGGGGLGLLHGLMHGARHTVVSHYSPVGRWLQRFGQGVFDKSGKLIGWINPMTGGFVTSELIASGTPQQAYQNYTTPAPADEGDTQ